MINQLEWKETPARRICCACGGVIPKRTKFLRETVYEPRSGAIYGQRIRNFCNPCAVLHLNKISDHVNNIIDEIEALA